MGLVMEGSNGISGGQRGGLMGLVVGGWMDGGVVV